MGRPTRQAVLFFFAGSVMLSAGAAGVRANDPCVANGTTLTCSGDQSDGVAEWSGAFETLLVNSLSGAIETSSLSGIYFVTNGQPMTLRSSTGPFGVSTTGDDAPGIEVASRVTIINGAHSFTSADVVVFSDDTIVTTGEESYGIGFDVVTAIVEATATADVSATGASINATSTGRISTYGEFAHGIDAFTAVSASATMPGSQAAVVGGDVTVRANRVQTFGDEAKGVFLRQNLSAIGDVLATSTGGHLAVSSGIVTTRGVYATGVGVSSTAWLQGGNASGSAAAITIESETVETFGDFANGLLAVVFGYADAVDVATILGREISVTNLGRVTTWGEAADGIVVSSDFVAVSDNAAAYARAGAVEINNEGLIDVRGDTSSGILVTGYITADTLGATAAAVAIADGVTVNSHEVRASGYGVSGISVYKTVQADSASGAQAHGPNVTINAHDVFVNGDDSVGIMAVNMVSSSSLDGSSAAYGGDILVKTTGTVSVAGANSFGIMAGGMANADTAEQGDVSIHVASGSVTADVAAIFFASEGDNGLANFGTISGLFAVVGGGGDEVIENWGTIIGSIDVGFGDNEFHNYTPGVFVSGDIVLLGSGTLTNAGLLTPGGAGLLQTTAVDGDVVQTESGRFAVDLDYATLGSDRLGISGTATLAGTVVAHAIEGLPAAVFNHQFHILHAAGGVVPDGLTAQDTAVVDYTVLFDPNGQDVYLGAAIDFSGRGGLNANQTGVGRMLNSIHSYGAPAAMAPAFAALMNLPTTADLARAYNQALPGAAGQQQAEGQSASADFSNTLMSCREAGGPNAAIREGECLWARARATDINVDGSATNVGSNSRVGSFAAGLQVAMAADWRIGVALGYDLVSRSTQSGASTDGDRTNIGAVVKYNPGPYLLAAGAAVGWGTFETDRRMAFGGFAATATSKSDTDYVTGWLHAAYLADLGRWYLKPLVEARMTELDFSGARETGGGGLGLVIAGARDTMFSVSPALEVGTEFRFDALAVWRPFVRAGVTWRDQDNLVTHAAFAAAPGVPGFQIVTEVDDVLFDISAGVDVIGADGAVLRAQYDGSFGSTSSQNSVSLKGSVPF
ncbi:hypothetical protein W911_08780 [Hyphomicrobium nitrativorans NL23]|uniref:Autotransporter domain-containing protein n=1 Tax=Hyphomicrobium nitrativorans NL23 TaxID=1029756 RepID=V5SET4_9HYPH|nr:autotransporter outer membrane beta-barrel domain-containing protein [Hyphomicrobium nitrativorans]AHB48469.1 hypothetical protein W911_08780 [Hyphomicrobium nitrativorans NL23]